MQSAQSLAPKCCAACGAKTKAPEYRQPNYSKAQRWPETLIRAQRPISGVWIVCCTMCPAVHVWSYPAEYKVHIDPITNVTRGQN